MGLFFSFERVNLFEYRYRLEQIEPAFQRSGKSPIMLAAVTARAVQMHRPLGGN